MAVQRVYVGSNEFLPTGDCVLVKPFELKQEETTGSGLVLGVNENSSVIDRPTMGSIVAVGIESKQIAETIVFWSNTDGIDFQFDDGLFVLLRGDSIIGSKV